MIELPEAITLGRQAHQLLAGKVLTDVFPPTHLSRFTFFNNDPLKYKDILAGKKILSVEGYGIFVDFKLSDNTTLSIGDGVIARYWDASAPVPSKYQLLLTFDDGTFLTFTVAMYGGIYAFTGELDNKYHKRSKESTSPLNKQFDYACFEQLFATGKPTLSAKALLATEQRIPGVGNGVLQDILFHAGINPKRKIPTLSEEEKKTLFQSLKDTLTAMTELRGRDTESDLLGNKGGYKTVLSKNTHKLPCPQCGGSIVKEAYMGGSIYYCPVCQKL